MSVPLLRPVLDVAVALSLTAAGAATAAPKKAKPKPKAAPPVCNLIVDDKGDDGGLFPHAETLDILTADIASNAKTVTAVLRLAKVANSDSNTAPTGRAWYLEFFVPNGDAALWLGAQMTPTAGKVFRYGWVDGSIRRTLGTVDGVFDEKKSEIRVSAPVGIWAERGSVKAGSKLTGLSAASYNFVGAIAPTGNGGGLLSPGDTAETSKTYTAGAPSCVAVGK